MNYAEAVEELELRDPATGGIVTAEELTETLESDVMTMLERPGSWEAEKVRGILSAHEFTLPEGASDAYGISLAVGRLQADAVLAVERPDSWEAGKILDLLQSHGLEPGGVSIGL